MSLEETNVVVPMDIEEENPSALDNEKTTTNAANHEDDTPTDIMMHGVTDTDENKDTSNAGPVEEVNDKDSTDDTMEVEDDDKDEDEDEDDDLLDNKAAKEDPEVLLIKASTCKEEGNKYFMEEKDFEKASRAYRKGVNAIKKLNKANSGDEQVKTLLLTLQTNLSMMQFKLQKYAQSQAIATKALEIDPYHVKALYRRAAARRKLGNPEGAALDLKLALSKEPNNTTCRKEFVALKKELDDAKKKQKASMQKAFSKGGLYEDKEEEKRKQEQRAKEQKQREEEALKKRKQEWEDECVNRLAKGEEAVSFDEWEKEQKKKIEQELKEAERKRKEEEKRLKEERRKAREAATMNKDDVEDEMESFTEKELAEMRGYKKTKDGRITSYFTREQSLEIDVTPKPIVSTTPQPITPSSSNGGENIAGSDISTSISGGGKGRSSAWNHAGTWEEKDASEWCRDHLTKRLKETKVEAPAGGSMIGLVKGVSDMTGEASVAIVSGKKRYIFDFHCKIKFEIRQTDSDEAIAKGSLNLPDICSTHHEELEIEFGGWKKAPSVEDSQMANDCRQRLETEVRESVKLWVIDFNNHY